MQAMIFQQLVNEDAGCIAYLIGCSEAGEALVVDPGRVRSPQDKGRVESGVFFVQRSFFAGEQFTGLADARARGLIWCTGTRRRSKGKRVGIS